MPAGSLKSKAKIQPARAVGRRPTGRGAHLSLRLLLALVLAVVPLLPLAQPMQVAAPVGAAGLQTSAMPCHGAPMGQPADAAADQAAAGQDRPAGCAHCSGDAPASACHDACQYLCPCAGLAGPVGPAATGQPPTTHRAGQTPMLAMVSDALPDSPGERLFRPPIVPC